MSEPETGTCLLLEEKWSLVLGCPEESAGLGLLFLKMSENKRSQFRYCLRDNGGYTAVLPEKLFLGELERLPATRARITPRQQNRTS